MVRKLALITLLMFLAAALVPLTAHAGRIGFKNNHPHHCYTFQFQTLKWNKEQDKWELAGDPKLWDVPPGKTRIYDGVIDGISWIKYAENKDKKCWVPSGTGFNLVWHTYHPTQWGTFNVIVDENGHVTFKKIR
ncbi:MAG: hypothetical protein K9K65_05035 [Desulfarculaceae bacterium]|nr:hypothetical protein [Desulfarculaceae bacterium]MCF8046129.1 hypothetical protein [Desulfarculaceae bacterium]MCF8064238.1 hypothetical protein [Desulfarculaceae bacterium]MCF8097186.1 hypothetical protein [Desulfarculaceae bacterium]MCF8123243.1 hypothetical protein [Desulfarculaceae bacterium]